MSLKMTKSPTLPGLRVMIFAHCLHIVVVIGKSTDSFLVGEGVEGRVEDLSMGKRNYLRWISQHYFKNDQKLN